MPPYPLIHDQETIRTLSELGVILLMFSLGLEFSLRKLKQVGGTAFIAAFLEILLMIWVGYEIGRFFGWSTMDSIFLGAMLSISSTTIIVKAFADRATRHRSTEMVFGILIVEDLIAILLLALLTPAGAQPSGAAGALGLTFFRLIAFLAAFLVAGMLVVPRFMRFVVSQRRSEITLVVSMGLCFGAAVLVQAIGYSVALGAFLAGALVAESGEAKVVERLAEPVPLIFLRYSNRVHLLEATITHVVNPKSMGNTKSEGNPKIETRKLETPNSIL